MPGSGSGSGDDSPTWRPTVAIVGAELRARTKDNIGAEVGTFNADTRPTAEQVEELIDTAVGEVAMRAGWDIPERLVPAAKQAAALRTVMLIEMGNYPEHSTGSDRTVYHSARLTFNEVMDKLALNLQWYTLAHRNDDETGS